MPKSPVSDPLAPFGPKYVDVCAIPIGIYACVSTDHQVGFRFHSCEHQTLVCRDSIQRLASCGWDEDGGFVDQAYSGANMDIQLVNGSDCERTECGFRECVLG